MPIKKEFTDVIFVRGLSHRAEAINAIAKKHRIVPVDLARGLVEAACDFYERHGFFSFPVRIEPEAFQQGYIEAESRLTAKYGLTPAQQVLMGPEKLEAHRLQWELNEEKAESQQPGERVRPGASSTSYDKARKPRNKRATGD